MLLDVTLALECLLSCKDPIDLALALEAELPTLCKDPCFDRALTLEDVLSILCKEPCLERPTVVLDELCMKSSAKKVVKAIFVKYLEHTNCANT